MPELILFPDEFASEDSVIAWVDRELTPDPQEAIRVAAREDPLGRSDAGMCAIPVLMREESEVEARICGHEFPLWVQCTARARRPYPFWRIQASPDPPAEAESLSRGQQ